MTRTRASAFNGVTPSDLDVDAPARTRTVLTYLVQELNLLYDKMTGQNGIAAGSVVDHDGTAGNGAPLRRVQIAQVMPAHQDASIIGGFGLAAADVATFGGQTCILSVPIYIAPGETDFWFEARGANFPDGRMRLRVLNSSGTAVVDIEAAEEDGDDGATYRQVVSMAGLSGRHYLIVTAIAGNTSAGMRSWRWYPTARRYGAAPTVPVHGSNQFPVGRAVGFGAGIGIEEGIVDEMIADNYAVSGWLLHNLNRNVNWIIEAATGAPPVGNATLTLADSSSTAPTASAFWAHGKAGLPWTTEGEVVYPVFSEALGGVLATALTTTGVTESVNSSMTRGLLRWAPIIPTYGGTTRRTAYRRVCHLPDFDTAPSKLKACFLMANSNGKGTPTAWDARVTTGAGSSAAVAFSQITGTQLYKAEVSAIPFDPDQLNSIDFELARSAGATQHGEIMLVGLELYFAP